MIRKCYKFYTLIMTLMWVMAAMTASAFAVDDMWTVANRIIVDVYTKIVGIGAGRFNVRRCRDRSKNFK